MEWITFGVENMKEVSDFEFRALRKQVERLESELDRMYDRLVSYNKLWSAVRELQDEQGGILVHELLERDMVRQ
jgi:hypothetical protein